MSNEITKEATDKLKVMGITLVKKDSVAKPITGIYDIHNIKEVATPICEIVNTAVEKKGITAYLGVLPDIFPAVHDIGQIGYEALDMDEDEFLELKSHIKSKLSFTGESHKYEEIVENIAIHVLGIVVETVKLLDLKNQTAVE